MVEAIFVVVLSRADCGAELRCSAGLPITTRIIVAAIYLHSTERKSQATEMSDWKRRGDGLSRQMSSRKCRLLQWPRECSDNIDVIQTRTSQTVHGMPCGHCRRVAWCRKLRVDFQRQRREGHVCLSLEKDTSVTRLRSHWCAAPSSGGIQPKTPAIQPVSPAMSKRA